MDFTDGLQGNNQSRRIRQYAFFYQNTFVGMGNKGKTTLCSRCFFFFNSDLQLMATLFDNLLKQF